MAFCEKCGKELKPSAKFCPNCGNTVNNMEESNFSEKRTEAYAGAVRKCPNCGQPLSGLVAVCPSCGLELNSVGVSQSVKEFERMLLAANPGGYIEYNKSGGWNTWSGGAKIGWVILWIYFWPIMIFVYLFTQNTKWSVNKLSPNEARRANLIESYTFSNEKETVLEALFFIKNQIESLKTLKKDGYMEYWVNLWKSKANHVYSKAKTAIGSDTKIEEAYTETIGEADKLLKSIRTNKILKFGLPIGLIIFIYLFSIIGSCSILRKATKSTQKSLEEYPDSITISSDEAYLTGIMGKCFSSISNDDIKVTLDKANEKITIETTLKCDKSLKEEIKKKMQEKSIEGDPEDYNSAYIRVNGSLSAYASTYDSEGIATLKTFEKLLDAKEGDEVPIKLVYNTKYATRSLTQLFEESFFSCELEISYRKDASYEHIE